MTMWDKIKGHKCVGGNREMRNVVDCIALRPRPVYIGVHDLEGKPPTVW